MAAGSETPTAQAVAQEFGGMVLEISPLALPVGVMVNQVNLTSEDRGVLQTRPGLKVVTFDE